MNIETGESSWSIEFDPEEYYDLMKVDPAG
jgi:hypothetical protein